MDINVIAKFDEIPLLPVQDIKEKPKCRGRRITKGNNPSPYFSIIYVHLVDIIVFAKFYEIPSLPFQDIENNQNITEGQMDGHENSIPPPPHTHKHSLRGYKINLPNSWNAPLLC